jgi:hypothetical protein
MNWIVVMAEPSDFCESPIEWGDRLQREFRTTRRAWDVRFHSYDVRISSQPDSETKADRLQNVTLGAGGDWGGSFRVMLLCFLLECLICASPSALKGAADIPIDRDRLEKTYREKSYGGICNLLSLEQVWSVIKSGEKGLEINLSGLDVLLDGSPVDSSKIYGHAYAGPYPFEAHKGGFASKRFRIKAKIKSGSGFLPVGKLLKENFNSEGWTDRGQLAIRLDLKEVLPGEDRSLGVYDTFISFHKTDNGFQRLPSIVEGPLVHMIRSDAPSACVISLRTDLPVKASIVLNDGRRFQGPDATRIHEIVLKGLSPAQRYYYRAVIEDMSTRPFVIQTAPLPGQSSGSVIVFAYAGDSREDVGAGMSSYMGINYGMTERLLSLAYNKGAAFMIMGGDLVTGNTTSTADMRMQYHAWKQAAAGFWHERPIYTLMGNHENLFRLFDDGSRWGIRLERWPYREEDSQTLFSENFVNPSNAPAPSDPERPPYEETVYSFQYGFLKIIALNTNYWAAQGSHKFGGAPEGYLFQDQLDWVKNELMKAEEDTSVRYVLLCSHEPLFPNDGHLQDAMWWNGDNNVRASSFKNGEMVSEPKGIVEVRNELARAIAACSKVAAVLNSDEHGYHRTLIGSEVPLGNPALDDLDGDGRLDRTSRLPGLKYRTWYVVSAGLGAPYYSENVSPWNRYWKERHREGKDRFSGYAYSAQENIAILRASEKSISLEVFNPYGERIDAVQDLLKAKTGNL